MPNIDVAKYGGPVTNNEVGRCWTHVREITFADFAATTSATDGDTITLQLFDIPTYAVVESVGFRLVTAFNDDASGTDLTVKLGDTTDDDGFVTAKIVHADATEVFIGVDDGAYFIGTDSGAATTSRVIKGKVYTTTGNTVEAVFTPTGNKCEELTSGKIIFFARILDTSLLY